MKQEKHFIVDALFVMVLFAVFAISALILVTIGADVYRHTVSDMGTNYETRTSVSYITEKIRQNDRSDSDISVTTLDNLPALAMSQEIGGNTYCTYLYYHEGYLKELFVQKGNSIGSNLSEAGMEIMPLQSLEMNTCSDNLLQFRLTTTDGATHDILVSLHCS